MDNEKMTTVEETTVETVATETAKKPKAWVAILVSIGALALFLGGQIVVSMIASTIASAKLFAEMGLENAEEVTQKLMEYVQSPAFLTPVLVISQLVVIVFAALWFFLGYVKKTSKEEKAAINQKVWKGKTLATVVLLAVGCYCVDLMVANLVSAISPEALENFNTMMSMSLGETSALSLIATIILAPIGEELIFRGIAFGKLKKALPVWVAILIQAVLFGLAHANIMQFCYVLPLAVVLGYVAYRYESIIPCIGIHMVNNALPNLVQLFPDAVKESMIPFAIGAVVFLAAAFFVQKDNLVRK